MLKDFKTFLLRGNVVDLAVGVVVGSAFTAVVNGFVVGFINPLITIFAGRTDFSKVVFNVGKTVFPIGAFITPLISFFIIATVIFFFVITPINKLTAATRRKEEKQAKEEIKTDAAMLEELVKIRRSLAKK